MSDAAIAEQAMILDTEAAIHRANKPDDKFWRPAFLNFYWLCAKCKAEGVLQISWDTPLRHILFAAYRNHQKTSKACAESQGESEPVTLGGLILRNDGILRQYIREIA